MAPPCRATAEHAHRVASRLFVVARPRQSGRVLRRAMRSQAGCSLHRLPDTVLDLIFDTAGLGGWFVPAGTQPGAVESVSVPLRGFAAGLGGAYPLAGAVPLCHLRVPRHTALFPSEPAPLLPTVAVVRCSDASATTLRMVECSTDRVGRVTVVPRRAGPRHAVVTEPVVWHVSRPVSVPPELLATASVHGRPDTTRWIPWHNDDDGEATTLPLVPLGSVCATVRAADSPPPSLLRIGDHSAAEPWLGSSVDWACSLWLHEGLVRTDGVVVQPPASKRRRLR